MVKKTSLFILVPTLLLSCSPTDSSSGEDSGINIGPDSPDYNFPYGDAVQIEGRIFARDSLKPVEPPADLPIGQASNFLIGDQDFADYIEKTVPWSGTYYIYDQTVRDFENALNKGELMMYFVGEFDQTEEFYLYQSHYYGGNGLYRYHVADELPEHMRLTTVIDIQAI